MGRAECRDQASKFERGSTLEITQQFFVVVVAHASKPAGGIKTCCGDVAIVAPGKEPHAAELRCAGCDAHRGWLPKQAFDFILKNSRRYGAPAEIVWRDRTIAIGDEKMTSEKKFDNSGILFRNEDKAKDADRDYQGSITVAGTEYWLSAWIKQGKRGKFMTLSVKPKQQAAASAKSKSSLADDMNDAIPF